MTEFCEAVGYAIYCVGLVACLITSLKTEEALIYIYDGPIAGLSSQVAVIGTHTLIDLYSLYRSKLRHPDHTVVVR